MCVCVFVVVRFISYTRFIVIYMKQQKLTLHLIANMCT